MTTNQGEKDKIEKIKNFLESPDFAVFEKDKEAAMYMELKEIGESLRKIAEKELPEMPLSPEVQKIQIEGLETITLKGEKGDTPKVGVDFDQPKDGENYVLTEKNIKEIAAQVPVPVVEKIIEKTEVIHEQPIVTNEVREVAIAESAEQIVEKINSLPTDEENENKKIDISHIKGFKDFEKDINYLKTRPTPGGIAGRDLFQDVDLSSQLDGATKTFNIAAVWNIISVHLSSFPHALRKGTDFTYTPTSITFTSEIDAALSLASGQTCVLTVINA